MIFYDKTYYVVGIVRSTNGLDRYEHRKFNKEDNARECIKQLYACNYTDLVDVSLTRVDIKTKHTTLTI